METNQNSVNVDDIIEFFKIYTNYLEYVLYISLTKEGINTNIHNSLMEIFVILTTKQYSSKRKQILNKLKIMKNTYFNEKYIRLNFEDKIFKEDIINIPTIQQSVDEFFEAISIFRKQNDHYLKQGVIEFHNFLAHLLVAFAGETKSTDNNHKKAINHLYRGTIDCYKSIIKNNCDEYCPFQKEIIEIREQEIKNLGIEATSTEAKYQLVKSYKNIVNKIIN